MKFRSCLSTVSLWSWDCRPSLEKYELVDAARQLTEVSPGRLLLRHACFFDNAGSAKVLLEAGAGECITQKNIAMHIAFRLKKKKPTLNDDEHSRYIWQKKKKNTLQTPGLSDFMAVSKVYKASLWPEEPLTPLLLFSFHTNSQSCIKGEG